MLLQSRLSLLLALLFCFFETSFFAVTASSSVPNPQADPDTFISANPMPTAGPSYPAYIGRFKSFLRSTAEGQLFIKEVLKGNVDNAPINLTAFRSSNTVIEYTAWYNSQFAVSGASAARIAEVEEQRVHAEAQRIDAEQRASAVQRQAEAQIIEAEQRVHAVTEELAVSSGYGDLTSKNDRLAIVMTESRKGNVRTEEPVKVSEPDSWRLDIPYTKNGRKKTISIVFGPESEVDAVLAMPNVQDKLAECVGRNHDLAALFEQSKTRIVVFDLTNITKVKGVYGVGLPIFWSDGREDGLFFSCISADEADEEFAKAEFLFSAGRAYNAASGAMSDLITDILSSAQPLDHHFKQIAQLASTSSRLEGYLKYHGDLNKKLTDSHALPLRNFLNIRFLSPADVVRARTQVSHEFDGILSAIPADPTGLPLGSQALGKFLKKIHSSIMLPTEAEFSTEEIQEIFEELGLLLETDGGEIVINSPFFAKLLEFSKNVTAVKKSMLSKNEGLYKEPQVQAAIKAIEESIVVANPAIPADFLSICETFHDPMNIGIKSKGLQKIRDELLAIPDRSLSMPLQDAGFCKTPASGPQIACIQPVLFLLQTFAEDQFNKVKKFSIIGDLDLAVQAACSMYYGRSLQAIKQNLLNSSHAFSHENYKKLKGSENVAFMREYLVSVMNGAAITVDLDALKRSALDIQTDFSARIKTGLMLRTCELINSSEFKPKLSVKEAVEISERSAYFDNPAIADAVLQYELQDNTLKTEEDKKKFLDSYINVKLFKPGAAGGVAEVEYSEKITRLNAFFTQSLAATAKDADLVKLVLTLPMLKQGYKKSHRELLHIISAFTEAAAGGGAGMAAGGASARNMVIEELLKKFNANSSLYSEDKRLMVKRILEKLLTIQGISKEFLAMANSAGAITVASPHAASSGPSFRVTVGLSQLDFDAVFANHDYNVFYNAVKILHFIELTMPSDDELEILKALMLSSMPDTADATEKQRTEHLLTGIIQIAKDLRFLSVDFYKQIAALMQFVEDFQKQKVKYDEPTGSEGIDFYANVNLLGSASAGGAFGSATAGGAIALAGQVERVYADTELGEIVSLAGPMASGLYKKLRDTGTLPEAIRAAVKDKYGVDIPIKYVGKAASAAPAAGIGGANKFIYAAANPLSPWFTKTEKKLAEEMTAAFGAVGALGSFNEASVKIQTHYEPLMQMQIAYLRDINFSKLKNEEDVFYLVRQLLTCVDLYLRIKKHEKFIADIDLIPPSQPGAKKDLERKLKAFETECLHPTKYTVGHIVKPYKTPAALSDQQTNDLLKKVKTVNPDLKKLIGNTIIQEFERGSTDIISRVLSVIDTYAGAW
ncbi:MAG: hypothetical protein WCJ92_05470 [Alphaproteobacteria bacterium]